MELVVNDSASASSFAWITQESVEIFWVRSETRRTLVHYNEVDI